MKRRTFVSSIAAAGLGTACSTTLFDRSPSRTSGLLPHRPYGDTGIDLSVIGFGGIVVSGVEQAEANDMVAWAVDRGVNYFDVAPTYGNAQERLGPALRPYRQKSFLACKTQKRDAAGARKELEESLQLLRTDHLDLYQLHALTHVKDVDEVMSPGGAMEVFVKAREKGQVRFLGFSAHSVDAAVKAMDAFDFDSVLFPFNVVCIQNGAFGPQVIDKAKAKGAARLALKAMAWTRVPKGEERPFKKCWYVPASDPETARKALLYTLSLPVTAAIPPGDPGLFKLGVELALSHRRLKRTERRDLLAQCRGVEPIFRHTL